MHDLRAVNSRVEPMTPLVADPYTILSRLRPTLQWYSVIELKDAFFSLRLAPQSIPLFAFTWENPSNGKRSQMAWARLAQGFVHSPTLFAEALELATDEFATDELNGRSNCASICG